MFDGSIARRGKTATPLLILLTFHYFQRWAAKFEGANDWMKDILKMCSNTPITLWNVYYPKPTRCEERKVCYLTSSIEEVPLIELIRMDYTEFGTCLPMFVANRDDSSR